MRTLIIHNVDDAIIEALQARAVAQHTSVEIEHLRILSETLSKPAPKSFANALASIPAVGGDSDLIEYRMSLSLLKANRTHNYYRLRSTINNGYYM